MPRRRFYIPRDQIREGSALLSPDQAHHLRAVLRLGDGDEVELFDGEGGLFSGRVESQGTNIRISALARLETSGKPSPEIHLAAALIKSDRFEWMLQKGTELGVARFIPLETRFASRRIPPARLEGRVQRWRRIVREASKQSRRLTIPHVQAPATFEALLAVKEYSDWSRIMLYEQASGRLQAGSGLTDRVLLCIGPEGGWDTGEADAAARAGFRLVTLGPGILRTETACLAAVAICRFLLDDPQIR